MAIQMRRYFNMLAIFIAFIIATVFIELMIINAILGCYTPDSLIAEGDKSCVPFSQLFGF
jgi:hypothetical protein